MAVFNRSYERLTHADPLAIVSTAGVLDAATTIRLLFRDELHRPERENIHRCSPACTRSAPRPRPPTFGRSRRSAVSRALPPEVLTLIIARLDGDIRDLPGLHALADLMATRKLPAS